MRRMLIANWLSKLSGKQVFFAPGPVICSLDPQVMETIFLAHPVLHLNEKEALDYTGKEDVKQAVHELYRRTGNLAIATLGENGTLYYDGGQIHTVSPVKTTVVAVIASMLYLLRYSEQWLMWVIVNALSIVMWIMVWASGDKSAVLIIIMDVINLCNSAYGYWNWRKIAKSIKA